VEEEEVAVRSCHIVLMLEKPPAAAAEGCSELLVPTTRLWLSLGLLMVMDVSDRPVSTGRCLVRMGAGRL
jgi:hypothetical protein